MNIFAWLLVGHLVGDWLLQNDWMARGKKTGLLALPGLVHYSIYTAITTGLPWLSGEARKDMVFYLAVGALIFLSHWLIDATRLVESWMRFFRQSQIEVVRLMADQTLHLLVLALVTALWLAA
jgi:hypothetical protein